MKSNKMEGAATSVPNSNSIAGDNRIAPTSPLYAQNEESNGEACPFPPNEDDDYQLVMNILQPENIHPSVERLNDAYLELLTAVKRTVEEKFKNEFKLHGGQVYLTFSENTDPITSPFVCPEMQLIWYPSWEKNKNHYSVNYGSGLRLMTLEISSNFCSGSIETQNDKACAVSTDCEEYAIAVWYGTFEKIKKWMEDNSGVYADAIDETYQCLKYAAECVRNISPGDIVVETYTMEDFCSGEWQKNIKTR